MSDNSDTSISPIVPPKGKRKASILSESGSDSDSSTSNITLSKHNGKRKNQIRESDSDSSIEKPRKIKRVPRVTSDSESSSDESAIVKRKKPARLVSDGSNNSSESESDASDNGFEDNSSSEDWESDWQSESENEEPPSATSKIKKKTIPEPVPSTSVNVAAFSDSSDGESEKCPICLLSFNTQEVGTPETCDHSFCAECIQEWSKNVNTCPVDRQTFSLILVRKRFNGKVIRRVAVDVRRPSVDELIQEDPTYCEVCGMSDREDRLLLCDGCDLGYHLECLDPPMDTVPIEEWFCSECRIPTMLRDLEQADNQHSRRPRTELRLLPRTSQSERVRATIATNRNFVLNVDQNSVSSGFEDTAMAGSSRSGFNTITRAARTTATTTRKKRKKTYRRRRAPTKILYYEINEKTGEKVAVRKKCKRRRRKKRRKKSNRRVVQPRTVKKRLAFQLGMCPPKKAGLAVPEVKIRTHQNHIGFQRSQAGIPTLHLFGQRDQIDYFSGSDEEFDVAGSGGVNILSQARTASSEISAMRRAARRKAVFAPEPPTSVSSCDILGSILDSQTKLHSKHSVISVTRDGKLHIENKSSHKKTEQNNNLIKPNSEAESIAIPSSPALDVTSSSDVEMTQAPMFPGRGGGGNRQPYGFHRGGGGGGGYRSGYDNGSNYNHFQGSGNSGPRGRGGYGSNMYNNQRDNSNYGGGYMNYYHGGPPPFRGRGGPPRFPMRRPPMQQHQQPPPPVLRAQPVELVLDDPIEENPAERDCQSQQPEEEEVDIYSDIEAGSSVPEEDTAQLKPPVIESQPQPALVAQIYNNSGTDDDSDSELVIDDSVKETDKYDPADPSNDTDSNSEPSLNKEKTSAHVNEVVQLKISSAPTSMTALVEESVSTVSENSTTAVTSVIQKAKLSNFSPKIVNEVVQQVLKEHLSHTPASSKQKYDDDMSDDDCPNFSIYSAESIDIAKSTDISVNIPKEDNTATSPEEKGQSIYENEEELEVKSERIDAEKTEEIDTMNASSKIENVDISDESCDAMLKENITLKSSELITENAKMINDEEEESECVVKEEEECAVSGENHDDNADTKDNVKQSQGKINKDESMEDDDAESLKDEDDLSNDDDDDDEDSNGELSNTPEPAIDEPNFDNKDDIKKSPKTADGNESVVLARVNINDSSASTTPPLPLKPQIKVELKSSPIKIAFNPNRKISLTDHSKKERVLQLYDDSDLEEWECKDDFTTKEIKSDPVKPNDVSEIEKMTEAISEEERSYTPCLDEKEPLKQQYSDEEANIGGGIGGLDTEMISDEERNDMFDESHDMKTISDGDALEINAKESELDLARPEDYEEGEIVEKLAAKKSQDGSSDKTKETITAQDDKKKRIKKKPDKEVEKDKVKESSKPIKKPEFKKLSKSNKERNYRDKEKARSRSKEKKGKENKENRRDKTRKEKKKDLERYNVRSLIAEKPKKDQFGRDIDRSPSRSSRSATPTRRSTSRPRRSHSWDKTKKRRRRTRSPRRSKSRSASRGHGSRSRSRARSPRRSRSFRRTSRSPRRSRSRSLRRSRSPRNKRYRPGHRSASRERYRNRSRRRSVERPRTKKKNRSVSRPRVRSRTPSPPKHRTREWERAHSYSREWTPSWSRSPSPRPVPRHTLPQSMSPSWTPPVAIEKGPVQPENLTVILTNNEVSKTKKKDKKKKADKKSKDEYRKRKRTDRTPPPSKEVFASGDNILVSVSFNKTSEDSAVATREVLGVKRKRDSLTETNKKSKKDKATKEKKKRAKSPKTRKKNKEVANMKPVAIIDLDRSPFKEITPSPKDIIVLSDSDNCEKEDETMGHHHDMMQEEEEEELLTIDAQNQEDSAPQSPTSNYLNSTGPKTPPEPQVKFLLSSKQTQLRAISNPLHDPNDEGEGEIDPQEELEHRLEDVLHKGPNTPPEPPSSPPSSPDAYDPFDPTKSRSPTPEPQTANQQVSSAMNTPGDKTESDGDLVDLAVCSLESNQKNTGSSNENSEKRSGSLDPSKRLSLSPDRTSQTRTPPTTGTETESESAKGDSNDKNGKSPERNSIGVVINQQVQPFPAVVKPIQSTAVYSSATPSIITSTPASSNAGLPRANLFNTTATVGGAPRMVPTSVPQRIILPTPAKSSPAKMSPLKSSPSKPPIKSTPIKPMPSKIMISKLPVPNVKPVTPIRKSSQAKTANRTVGQNGNEVIDVDLDFESPYSPGSSDYEDLFEPPVESTKNNSSSRTQQQPKNTTTKSPAKQNTFDNLFGSSPVFRAQNNKSKSKSNAAKVPVKMNKKSTSNKAATNKTQVGVKVDEDNLKILDDLPNSAVEMQVKDKFLKKLNRQERVVEEVKLVLKPHYNKKHVTKEQYKDILRRAVPKICHNRSGEINPKKIQNLIEAYVKKARHAKKVSTSATTTTNTTGPQSQTKSAKTTLWS
ncbi:uncharacterized protein CBL_07012 [Carabus blaptoides fortunei]